MPKNLLLLVLVLSFVPVVPSVADELTPWRDIDLTVEERETLALSLMESGNPVLYVSDTLRYVIVAAGYEHLIDPVLLEYELFTYSTPGLVAETVVGVTPEEDDEVTYSGAVCAEIYGPLQCNLDCEPLGSVYIKYESDERTCVPSDDPTDLCTMRWVHGLCSTAYDINYSDPDCSKRLPYNPPGWGNPDGLAIPPDFGCDGPSGWTCGTSGC